MKRLLRIFGLVVALGSVSFTSVDAWPIYDLCAYYCTDGKTYDFHQRSSTHSECCSSASFSWWCPPGQTSTGGFQWGGTYVELESC